MQMVQSVNNQKKRMEHCLMNIVSEWWKKAGTEEKIIQLLVVFLTVSIALDRTAAVSISTGAALLYIIRDCIKRKSLTGFYSPMRNWLGLAVFLLAVLAASVFLGDMPSIQIALKYIYWALPFFLMVYFNKRADARYAVVAGMILSVVISSGNVASMKALLNITGEALPEADDSSKGDSSSEGETQTATQATTKAVPANGISENVKFYQDRVVIAGDSVAYGFCAYGYVPYEHNIAKGSTALRQYDDKSLFTFDPTGKELGFVDAIEAVKPSLLYISMGMNDVNLIDAEKYVQRYKELIEKVKNKVPDCVIVTAAITPITQASKFTNIENIRTFNTALKKMVEELKDPNVVFFDAYNAIVGPDGVYIPNDYSPSDGVHVAGHCYKTLLEKLALTLDQYDMKKKIEDIEAKRK